MKLLAGEVVEQDDVVESLGLLGLGDLAEPWAVADEEEDDILAVPEAAGGFEELVEPVGQSEVAGIEDDKLVLKAELVRRGWPSRGRG